MDLETYLNYFKGNTIDITSLRENEGLMICKEKYANLYKSFLNNGETKYHNLCNSKNMIDELYMLINEIDIKLDSEIELIDIKLQDEMLLLNLQFEDSLNKTKVETFSYNLSNAQTSIELKTLLQQEEIILYLLMTVDNYLLQIGSKRIILNKKVSVKIIGLINEYLQDYEPRGIEVKDNKPNLENFVRYNWVDASKYLQEEMLKFDYMKPWFEDAWNILMFDSHIISHNVMESEYCSDNKKGDIAVWLLSLYDLFLDYQLLIKEEVEDNIRFYKKRKLISFLKKGYIDQWQKLLSEYLYNRIMNRLNECLSAGYNTQVDFYDTERKYFNFDYEYMEEDTLAFEVLLKEVRKRRIVLVDKIYRHFKNNDREIILFLTGNHWRVNYTNYNKRIEDAKLEFERYLKVVEDIPEDINDFFYSFDELLDEIRKEYPVSVDYIEDEILSVILGGSYSRYAKLNPVFVWVTIDHMKPLV